MRVRQSVFSLRGIAALGLSRRRCWGVGARPCREASGDRDLAAQGSIGRPRLRRVGKRRASVTRPRGATSGVRDSAVARVRVGASRLCRAATRGNGGDSVVARVRGDLGFGGCFCSAACGHAARSRGVEGVRGGDVEYCTVLEWSWLVAGPRMRSGLEG